MATDADQEWATELAREVLVQDSAIDTVSPDLRLAVAASRILAALAKRDAGLSWATELVQLIKTWRDSVEAIRGSVIFDDGIEGEIARESVRVREKYADELEAHLAMVQPVELSAKDAKVIELLALAWAQINEPELWKARQVFCDALNALLREKRSGK